jgi:hypothetical protein
MDLVLAMAIWPRYFLSFGIHIFSHLMPLLHCAEHIHWQILWCVLGSRLHYTQRTREMEVTVRFH